MHTVTHRLSRIFTALACAALLVVAPATTLAFDMPSVHITADVQPNGDVVVAEARTFSFDDDVNGVFWNIPFASNQQGNASSIDIKSVSVKGTAYWLDGASQTFTQTGYASSGDTGVYTLNQSDEGLELKVFMPQEEDDEATVTLSYVLHGAVMAWSDTAELYWKFIGSEWEESSEDVQLDVTFVGAQTGSSAVTGTDDATLRAWGHGPLDGSVSLDAGDGHASVQLVAPEVDPGQFAEVRVTFPNDWVPDLAASGESRLETVLAEEQAWADEANARREHARMVTSVGSVIMIGVSAALLVGTIVLRLTAFKNPKPVFAETYFRDLPSDDHPAVLSALMNDGAVQGCTFVATLMGLTDDRVVELVEEKRTEKKLLRGEQEVTDYALRLLNKDGAHSRIDRIALELYFGKHADDGDLVRFDEMLSDQVEDKDENAATAFSAEVKAQLEKRNLTDQSSFALKVVLACLAGVIIMGDIFFLIFTDGAGFIAAFASALISVVTIVLTLTAKKFSQEAVDLRERCVALKRWLEDFTRLNEAVPSDLILWNKLLVMAVAFGVSDDVVRELAEAVPREARVADDGTYYYPSYYWYYSYGHRHSPMNEMTKSYGSTVRELAMSSNSSGGGFGGGFSGGGGGGVGGGGGGTF